MERKVIAGTYRILNKINNKVYNGSSIKIDYRLNSHKRSLRKGGEHNKHLQNAFDKYGEENFVFEKLEEIAIVWDWKNWTKEQKLLLKETLLYWEQKHLSEDKSWKSENGYNICQIAGSTIGYKFTKDQLEYQREACSGKNNGMYGKKHSLETLAKISKKLSGENSPWFRRHHSEKTRELLRQQKIGNKNPMFGHSVRDYMTKEAYNKMNERIRAALKGRKKTEEAKVNMKKAKRKIYYDSIVDIWS